MQTFYLYQLFKQGLATDRVGKWNSPPTNENEFRPLGKVGSKGKRGMNKMKRKEKKRDGDMVEGRRKLKFFFSEHT